MAYRITDACAACGTCAGECPVGAISEGDICKYEYAANVSKVQRFISIGHAAGDHSPLGKLRAGFRLFMKVFFLAHVTSASKRIIYNLV